MEDKKLAAIQAAYGDAWEKVKDYIDENGWISVIKLHNAGITINAAEFEYKPGSYRPISLSGLESNNGWTRFEEGLPDKHIKVHYCIKGSYCGTMSSNSIRRFVELGDSYSHWQPVVSPKSPIY